MKPIRVVSAFASALLLAAARGDGAQPAGTVCPDPARPCPGFKAHDLSFVLPRGGTARAEDRSHPFFAVLLRSGPRCSITEEQRRAAQLLPLVLADGRVRVLDYGRRRPNLEQVFVDLVEGGNDGR